MSIPFAGHAGYDPSGDGSSPGRLKGRGAASEVEDHRPRAAPVSPRGPSCHEHLSPVPEPRMALPAGPRWGSTGLGCLGLSSACECLQSKHFAGPRVSIWTS